MENRDMDSDNLQRKIEILAPAGSYDCFRAAVNAGADAVYAGGPRFGARAYADNFSEKELIQAIGEAHLHGRRFYLTVNTLLKETEIGELFDYLAPLYEAGLDAVIVQDMGVFEFVRTNFPGMDIHASTQMTITNARGARFLEEQGAVRVVPARELSLSEIRKIREETGLEIECFVHGALCYCYSGQCLLSSMIGGRSGNRGQCAQPCRLPYTVDGEKKYFLSLKDICTLELIPEMIEAGIDSFKIEGRMKNPEYVAAVTAMYRKYTDLYLQNGKKDFRVEDRDREILMDLYNRGGSHTGYYKEHNGRDMLALERPNHAGVPAVRVTAQQGREIRGIALTGLKRGDVLETGGGRNNYTLGKEVKEGESLSFLVQKAAVFKKGSVFNRIRNEQLIRRIHERYLSGMTQVRVSGNLVLCEGAPAYLTVSCGDTVYMAESSETVQAAQNRPLTESEAESQIRKTGNSEFCFEKLEITADDNIFLPVQQLKMLRREAFAGLKEALLDRNRRKTPDRKPLSVADRGQTSVGKQTPVMDSTEASAGTRAEENAQTLPFSVLVSTVEQLQAAERFLSGHPNCGIRRVYAECRMSPDFFRDPVVRRSVERIKALGVQVVPALPHIFRDEASDTLTAEADLLLSFPADGFLIRNQESFHFLRKLRFDKTVILDHNLYVFNRYAKEFWKRQGVCHFTAPLELNESELEALGVQECEMVAYGYLPVMISAQCVRKTASGCSKKPGITVLTDRYKKKFKVENCCQFCYNIIYNSEPLYLGNQIRRIGQLAPASLRFQFSTESGADTEKLLAELCDVFSGKEKSSSVLQTGYTQGHFKRGII